MPMWRCPHCGTPQPEAARCWVCHRSSTTCSTCRHFRRSLAANVAYCGLDPRRARLSGTEHRGCWTEVRRPAVDPRAPVEVPVAPVDPAVARLRPTDRRRPGVLEGFVPIELIARGPRTLQPVDPVPAPPPAVIEAVESRSDRETLFGDLDP